MNIRKIIMIVLVLFSLLTIKGFGQDKPGGKFKSGSEPEGFRGIKWGTQITTLPDMKCVQGEDGFYYKIGDKLKLGDANLTNIRYGFNKKGEFDFLLIKMEGKDNFNRMMDTFFRIFGAVNPIDQYDNYVWRGSKTVILVDYDANDKNTTISMWSSKSEAERERKKQEDEKCKLKEVQDRLKEVQKEFK